MVQLLHELFSLEEDFQFNAQKQRAGLTQLLDSDRSLVLVAETDARVIGMCSGQVLISTAEGGPCLLVEDVVVTENHRGHGTGRKLLEGLSNLADQRGISRLQLLADLNNQDALDFYRKSGWQPTRLICLRTYSSNGRR